MRDARYPPIDENGRLVVGRRVATTFDRIGELVDQFERGRIPGPEALRTIERHVARLRSDVVRLRGDDTPIRTAARLWGYPWRRR